MKKKILLILSVCALSMMTLTSCGKSAQDQSASEEAAKEESTEIENQPEEKSDDASNEAGIAIDLEDGVYSVDFETDSPMFHVNETCDGKGTLTVKDKEAVLHITLASENIIHLYPGLAEDAQRDGAVLLEPTTDTVTYEDGLSEEVYGFDVPVEFLDQEFDLALIGTKGKWYDHKVKISNPEMIEE